MPYQTEDLRRKTFHPHPTQAYQSTQAQQYEEEFYEEDTFDEAQDWQHHPWKINDNEDIGDMNTGNLHQGRPQPTQRHQQQYGQPRIEFQRQPPNYNAQLLYQHRAVARGPKLTFLEFHGEDADGWIRKGEKYFEMVGVPVEEWVKTVVLYVEGKAKFCWRGTGYNASLVPWPNFCQMVTDRFNRVSEYDIIAQFHNLKQSG